jgi:predicted RNA binding protein YcfA (HicA-like mRNA interferase family)
VTKVPSISYVKVVNALQRAGFVVVRQKGSHIRLQKRTPEGVTKLTVPAHRPLKRTTLARIIKHAGLTVEQFKDLQ